MRLAALFSIILGLVCIPGIARACGAFAAPPGPTDAELVAKLPYLTVEQVLVVWDKDTQTEDFVREARFARTNQTFGFVVPIPTMPEVSGVKDAPFERLRAKYPFEEIRAETSGGGSKGGPMAVAAAPPPTVEVLEKQRIGSFTAFTLATTDAGAFDAWLADNGFAMTKESKPWIAHYVRLKFFFVAFRYEPTDAGGDGMTSETVRIRFKTPNPYYPYMEPEHAANAPRPNERMLSGWLVTREPMLAVVARPHDRPRLGRPWTFGIQKSATSEQLTTDFGPDLAAIVPKSDKPLIVQPIRDSKISRGHFGDVVLVPTTPTTFSQTDIDARRSLLGVVDHVIIGEEDQEPALEIEPTPPRRSRACTMESGPAPGGLEALFFVGIIGIALFARRRRVLLAFVLVGCRTPTAAPADAGPEPPPSPAERERIALDVLAGKTPPEGIAPNLPFDKGLVARAQLGPALTIDGGLLPTARRTLSAQAPAIRRCFEIDLAADPNKRAQVVVSVGVGTDGAVTSADVVDEIVVSPGVVTCVKGVLRNAKFDPPSERATVKAMYLLSAG